MHARPVPVLAHPLPLALPVDELAHPLAHISRVHVSLERLILAVLLHVSAKC